MLEEKLNNFINLWDYIITNGYNTLKSLKSLDISCDYGCNVVNLPIDILDTQNYITSSDIVITKSG